jgi:hypothetical protein
VTMWDKRFARVTPRENGPVVPPASKVDDPVVSIENGPVVPPAGLIESLFLYRE